jgi:rhodanese-related sulfurtransferase
MPRQSQLAPGSVRQVKTEFRLSVGGICVELEVALWLHGEGFRPAVSLVGGIDAWVRQIDPNVAAY